MSTSQLETLFAYYWRILAPQGMPEFEREQCLIPGRKFRVDFCNRASMVVVEVDGGQFKANGGRHNTDTDREKINLLTLYGWRVLRYSGTMIKNDPDKMVKQVASAILNIKPAAVSVKPKRSRRKKVA